MMRLLIAIILIGLLAFGGEYFFPWWITGIIAFIVAFTMRLRAGAGFIAGFLGVGLLWLIVGLVTSTGNDHILANRMAELFHLPGAVFFLLVAAIIGAIAGGLAAWSGALLRQQLG